MKYHSTQCLYQPNQQFNFNPYHSFAKKPCICDRLKQSRQDNKQKSYVTVFPDDLNDTVPQNRSTYEIQRYFLTQSPGTNDFQAQRQSRCSKLQNKSWNQHSANKKSSMDGADLRSLSLRNQEQEQKNGQVYKEIINILEKENHNLKEHNRFLLNQYKKIQKQNYQLKQVFSSRSSIASLQLETEVQKLKEMNQIYQKQVQQLKYILMEEMVAIHQKFSLVISGQESSDMVQSLTQSIRKSEKTINMCDLQNCQSKIQSPRWPHAKSNIQGMILSELLSFQDQDESIKDQVKTFETSNKENNSSSQNCEYSSMESPPQTTFSGRLRLSDRAQNAYDKQQLTAKLHQLMQRNVNIQV